MNRVLILDSWYWLDNTVTRGGDGEGDGQSYLISSLGIRSEEGEESPREFHFNHDLGTGLGVPSLFMKLENRNG